MKNEMEVKALKADLEMVQGYLKDEQQAIVNNQWIACLGWVLHE